MNKVAIFQTILLIVVLFLASSPVFSQKGEYGKTTFHNSGNPKAQKAFLKGLLMLHSFQYEDARENFQNAQKIDPDFAMAYWGETMTHNHPIWHRQDRDAARAALKKLAATPEARIAKAPTRREKDYLATLDILFGEGDKETRDLRYVEAIGKLAAKYPDDLDAAAFYALAILGTSHNGRDFATYMKAAAIVEEVFDKNPQHPGAAHYLIHAYDDPVHAPLGLRPARLYAKIAPSASHALHMPSHIFVALGMWDHATQSNIDAYNAAKNRSKRKKNSLSGHGYHALYWLSYSYFQQGRYTEASQQLKTINKHFKKNKMTRSARSHRLLTWATYLINTENWNSKLVKLSFDISKMNPGHLAAYQFVKGMAALHTGRQDKAEQALGKIKSQKFDSKTSRFAGSAKVMQLELEALIEMRKGKNDKAIELMQQAVATQNAMPLHFGPPWPPKPSHELFGEVLLKLKRPKEAQEQFELALKKTLRRTSALLGLARAASLNNDKTTAQQSYRELYQIWHKADKKLPMLKEVKLMVSKE